VYPLAAVFQEQDKSFRVRILRSGFDGALEVERFYEEDGEYRRFLSVAATEPGSPLSELEIRTEELYRVRASLEGGTLDFFLPLWQPRGPLLEARALPRGARLARPQSGATCYAFTTPAGLGVLNLPPEEFFPLPANLNFPPPRRRACSTSFCCLFPMA
jgi:hypothetical protein